MDKRKKLSSGYTQETDMRHTSGDCKIWGEICPGNAEESHKEKGKVAKDRIF